MIMRTALVASLAALAGAAGCGDDAACGPADTPADAITMTVDGVELGYGAFTSSPNNDCPDPDGPTSLTLAGEQIEPEQTGFALTFCLPRPDRITADPIPIDDDRVEVVDVSGQIDGCQIARDSGEAATGTITFIGYCADGLEPAGYAIELSATFPGTRTCAGVDEPVDLVLSGSASVMAINLPPR